MIPEKDVKDLARIDTFAKANSQMQVYDKEVLYDTIKRLYQLMMIPDKDLSLKSYFIVIQSLQENDHCGICTENIFVLSCAYLQVNIHKDVSIYLLREREPVVENRKKHLISINALGLIGMKKLVSALSIPEEGRGRAARSRIIHGVNYLNNRLRLYTVVMPKLINLLKQGKNKAFITSELKLSCKEYEHLTAWARAEGLIAFNCKRSFNNNYVLKKASHVWVKELAKQQGLTPQEVLDAIVENFQKILSQREKANAA